MPKKILKRGATSNILRVFLQDSASTTGAGKTALTSASSGLIISTIADLEATATTYTSAATNVETITTLGTFAAPTASKCRFREVDATNFPGVYEIHIADARFAVANTTQLLISIQCTGVSPVFVEYQFVAVDLMDTIRFGLTALPNTAVTTNGSLITSGTGTAQLSVASGLVTLAGVTHTGAVIPTVSTVSNRVSANTDQWNGVAVTGMPMPTYTQPAGFLSATFPGGTIANTTNITAGTITTATGVTNAVTVGTINNNVITAASIAADAITAAKFADDALVIQSAAALGNKIRFASDAITSTVIATDAITNAELAATAVQEIWDYNISAYVTAGLAGTYLKNAGAAGNPWLTDIGNAVTYPVASTAGGYLRDNLSKTGTIENDVSNLPLDVWTSIFTSDSTTYGQFSSYSMVDVMALLAKGYCAIFGTVQTSPAPTTTTAKTSLTGYVNSAFNDQTVVFLRGSSIAGSCTVITSSNASGNLVFDEPLHQAPNVGDEFMILPMHVHLRSAIADKLLGRSIAGGADGGRTVTSALRPLRNRTSITGSVLTVTDETDNLTTGVAWTANLTTDVAAIPITGIDPV